MYRNILFLSRVLFLSVLPTEIYSDDAVTRHTDEGRINQQIWRCQDDNQGLREIWGEGGRKRGVSNLSFWSRNVRRTRIFLGTKESLNQFFLGDIPGLLCRMVFFFENVGSVIWLAGGASIENSTEDVLLQLVRDSKDGEIHW